MNTKFSIKNFRVFDENGVDLELKPITILTGKNSAGKSSIVKAIAVLNSFLEQIRRDKENNRAIKLSTYRLHFNELFEQTLGNFKSVINKNAVNNCITFEYQIHSSMLFQDLKVSFSFKDESVGKDDHYSHNGVISRLCVKNMQDVVIFSSNDGHLECNLNEIKKSFYNFSLGEFYSYFYLGAYSVDSFEKTSIEKINKKYHESKAILENYDDCIRNDIYRYLRIPHSSKEPIIKDGDMFSAINKSKEDDLIFQIPVIYNFLGNLKKDEISERVEEILHSDRVHDDEKDIIMRLINDILNTDSNICDYWKEQEKIFLQSIKYPLTDDEQFISFTSEENVMLPNASKLHIKQNLWVSKPDLFRLEDISDLSKEICDIDRGLPLKRDGVLSQYKNARDNWVNTPLDSFSKKYEVMMRLNSAYERWLKRIDPEYSKSILYTFESDIERPAGEYIHKTYCMLCEYASRAIESALFPVWADNFLNIPSSRALPKRLYTPETGNDFYQTLNEYLIAKTEYENYQNAFRGSNKNEYVADTFLNRWIGKDGFEIGKTISVESVMGSAIVVKLIKKDGNEVYLTDEGYGLTQLVSILISIETSILKARGVKYNNFMNQSDLDGLNTLNFYYEQQTITIEEPEIHLHPAFQSKLADMFASALEYNIHFIVETHSEYLIRKLQKKVAIKKFEDKGILQSSEGIDRNIISIYYLYDYEPESRPKGSSQLLKISLGNDGIPDKPFGKGFFEVADELSMELLTLKMQEQ